ncbi:MAG: IS1595 family transposase [Alphaproteobacteria bacterium]|nr:IS1595 family transposase [Alphaproteobacteria bacterium]
MKKQTIQQFFKQYPSDEDCLEHLMKVRYGMEGFCPSCGAKTKFSRVSSQRAYACQWCGWHTYPCVGTPFENSRTSLQLWFYAIYLFTTTRSGVSAKELQRQLGVTYKCAWRMGHEIRKHMDFVDGNPPLNGTIEMDETFIGGHKKDSYGGRGKAVLFGMLDRDGGIHTQVVKNRKHESILPIIANHVEAGSIIYTDYYPTYEAVKKMGHHHNRVNHSVGEYAKGDVHINTIESYWSRLKLSIRGTHIHVSAKHLDKYAKEFEYRFNSRNNPAEMLPELLSTFEEPSQKPSKKE